MLDELGQLALAAQPEAGAQPQVADEVAAAWHEHRRRSRDRAGEGGAAVGVAARIGAVTQHADRQVGAGLGHARRDRKSTRLNSSHQKISYAVFCLTKNPTTEPGLAISRLKTIKTSFSKWLCIRDKRCIMPLSL